MLKDTKAAKKEGAHLIGEGSTGPGSIAHSISFKEQLATTTTTMRTMRTLARNYAAESGNYGAPSSAKVTR